MKQLFKLLMLAGVLHSSAVLAGERINKHLDVDGITTVNIDVLRGDVKILGRDTEQISVQGELDEQAKSFTFEPSGKQMLIKVNMPRKSDHHDNDDGSKLTITLPHHLKVNFQGVSTDVHIENNEKGADIRTVSGSITAKNLAQRVELNAVSGDITTLNLSGKIALSTVNGSIADKHSSGRLQLKAVSGDIETSSQATELRISVVSGDVDFSLDKIDELKVSSVSGNVAGKLTLNEEGNIKMSGVSADFDIAMQSSVSASFKLSTSAGGRIKNSLTKDKVQRAKYGPSSKLYFSTGDASGSVKASVVSGRINIHSH